MVTWRGAVVAKTRVVNDCHFPHWNLRVNLPWEPAQQAAALEAALLEEGGGGGGGAVGESDDSDGAAGDLYDSDDGDGEDDDDAAAAAGAAPAPAPAPVPMVPATTTPHRPHSAVQLVRTLMMVSGETRGAGSRRAHRRFGPPPTVRLTVRQATALSDALSTARRTTGAHHDGDAFLALWAETAVAAVGDPVFPVDEDEEEEDEDDLTSGEDDAAPPPEKTADAALLMLGTLEAYAVASLPRLRAAFQVQYSSVLLATY